MTDFRRLVANSQSSSISAHQSNGPAMSFTPATTSFGSTVPIYHRKEQTQQSKVINMSRLANNARSGHIGSASAPSSMPVPSVPVTSMPVPSMPVPSASISTRTRPIASVSHATLIALTEPFLLSWCLPYGPTLSSN
jgi:hypothetical protein